MAVRVAGGRGEGRYSVGCFDVRVEPNHCGFEGGLEAAPVEILVDDEGKVRGDIVCLNAVVRFW